MYTPSALVNMKSALNNRPLSIKAVLQCFFEEDRVREENSYARHCRIALIRSAGVGCE